MDLTNIKSRMLPGGIAIKQVVGHTTGDFIGIFPIQSSQDLADLLGEIQDSRVKDGNSNALTLHKFYAISAAKVESEGLDATLWPTTSNLTRFPSPEDLLTWVKGRIESVDPEVSDITQIIR